MNKNNKGLLALFLRDNKENKHKINLIEYMQEQICKYSNQENTPAEQIKGMNRLLRDIMELPSNMFEEKQMAYTQNWDSKGNIYYTDENGQVVNFKVNPFTQLANKAKATAYNVGNWINETNPNSEAYKQKVGAILGLATAPFGLGATLTGGIAKGLVPVVGRKIAQNMASVKQEFF